MEHLLPEALFDARSTSVLFLILAFAIAMVVKGADWLVESAVGISTRFGVPKVIVGATIVSLGTTTPEAAVSVMAAFNGLPDFALGNSVGSIICDTGLLFGICCMMTRLPMDRFVLNRHGWLQFASGLLLVAVAFLFRDASGAHVIPRGVGFFFMALLVGYMGLSVYWAKQHSKQAKAQGDGGAAESEHEASHGSVGGQVFFLLLGLVLVIVASHIMIQSVRVICLRMGVPPAIVAATLIAFGTSLPELVTGITCIIKKHSELLVGNIIGADILNVLFVTGAAATAVPLTVDPMFFRLHFPVMVLLLILFRATIHFSKNTFARWPGAIFVGIYLLYIGGNFVMNSAGQ